MGMSLPVISTNALISAGTLSSESDTTIYITVSISIMVIGNKWSST